jgi:DNA-binding transcriptional MerR regulator
MAEALSRGLDVGQPIYNIGAVVRMTGIPEATLRAWERRYGFPRLARTSGHHRLYSESQVRRLQYWRDQVPGTFLGATLREGVEALDRLMRDATLLMR